MPKRGNWQSHPRKRPKSWTKTGRDGIVITGDFHIFASKTQDYEKTHCGGTFCGNSLQHNRILRLHQPHSRKERIGRRQRNMHIQLRWIRLFWSTHLFGSRTSSEGRNDCHKIHKPVFLNPFLFYSALISPPSDTFPLRILQLPFKSVAHPRV